MSTPVCPECGLNAWSFDSWANVHEAVLRCRGCRHVEHVRMDKKTTKFVEVSREEFIAARKDVKVAPKKRVARMRLF